MTSAETAEIISYMPGSLSSSDRASVWIEMAAKRCSKCYFGSAWTLAVAYLASHVGTLEKRAEDDGTMGPVTSKEEGDISVGYGSVSSDGEDDLSLTAFGLQYKMLLKQCSKRPGVTGHFGPCVCGGFR